MREHPILFHPHNVQSILAGLKTQTRRVMRPLRHPRWTGYTLTPDYTAIECGPDYPDDELDCVRCSFGVPGDRLWVREPWRMRGYSDGHASYTYRADFPDDNPAQRWPWSNSMFMPREASRVELEITELRIQQVQEISEEDAKAEGVEWHEGLRAWRSYDLVSQTPFLAKTAVESYRTMWDFINGKKYPWSANPWVWCISFKVVKVYESPKTVPATVGDLRPSA